MNSNGLRDNVHGLKRSVFLFLLGGIVVVFSIAYKIIK